MPRRPRSTPKPDPKAGPDALMAWYVEQRREPDPRIDADVSRSCTRKQQYASADDAHAHALMNGMGDVLYEYECRYCGFWHLTKRPT